MKKSNLTLLSLGLPLSLSLSLALAACGGSDSDGDKNTGGSGTSTGGKSSSGGTSASSAGSSSDAGSPSDAGSSSTAGKTGGGGGSSSGGSGNHGGSTSNPGGGGDFDTGLPSGDSLGSLSDSDWTSLCDKVGNYFEPTTIELDCRIAGLISAAFSQPMSDQEAQAACKTSYDSCKSGPAESMQMCKKPTGTCTATVAELEACANDTEAMLKDASNAIPSCQTLTLDDLMNGGGDMPEPTQPASCATLNEKCPGAVTTDTSAMP